MITIGSVCTTVVHAGVHSLVIVQSIVPACKLAQGSRTCYIVALRRNSILSHHNNRNEKRYARLQTYDQGSWKELGVVSAVTMMQRLAGPSMVC